MILIAWKQGQVISNPLLATNLKEALNKLSLATPLQLF